MDFIKPHIKQFVKGLRRLWPCWIFVVWIYLCTILDSLVFLGLTALVMAIIAIYKAGK